MCSLLCFSQTFINIIICTHVHAYASFWFTKLGSFDTHNSVTYSVFIFPTHTISWLYFKVNTQLITHHLFLLIIILLFLVNKFNHSLVHWNLQLIFSILPLQTVCTDIDIRLGFELHTYHLLGTSSWQFT